MTEPNLVNQATTPVQPSAPAPMQQAPQVQPVVNSGESPKNKNLMLFGIIGGIIIVLLLGAGLYFYMSSKAPKQLATTNTYVATPTPTAEPTVATSSVAQVNSATDLDQVLSDVDKSDNSLQDELTAIEKDSNF